MSVIPAACTTLLLLRRLIISTLLSSALLALLLPTSSRLSLIVRASRSVRSGPASSRPTPLKHAFYHSTCPNAESIAQQVVTEAVAKEARMAGSLLRLHFHDCFVQGCDGSLLLKTVPGTLEGEQEARPNANSLRGFDVVDDIKAALEVACPGVVSCADVLAMAARDSVALSGGPHYNVMLGRRDSLSANRSLAEQSLPGFNFNVSDLVANFATVGLSLKDMVVLSGGHTIGKANCASFASRLMLNADDPTALNATYRKSLAGQCPSLGAQAGAFVDLDVATPDVFDNAYYSNLMQGRGLLHSDQVLYSTAGATRQQVARYATHPDSFLQDFPTAMIRMGNISPLTGSKGQIRTHCGYVN